MNYFQELMEELIVVLDLAYTLLSVDPTSLRYRLPEMIIHQSVLVENRFEWIPFKLNMHWNRHFELTDRSTLTTRDAKLIFDAYTSLALDPCFPRIWSNLLISTCSLAYFMKLYNGKHLLQHLFGCVWC